MFEDQKRDPYGFTIFCDDVREEASGQSTYVGVYKDALVLDEKLPCDIPTFRFVVHLVCSTEQKFDSLKLKIVCPGEEAESPEMSFDVPNNIFSEASSIEGNGESAGGQIHIVIKIGATPLRIEDYGSIRVSAIWDSKLISLGSLSIKSAEGGRSEELA